MEINRLRIVARCAGRLLASVLSIAAIAWIAGCGIAFGQAVSQISGSAKDQTGAVVPGVEVTATQTDTGVKRTVMTDANGDYVLPNLPIGPYRIEASKTGFRTYVQSGIQLEVDSNPQVPLVLGVGEVTQTVQVEANAVLVETQKLGVGTVMESQRVLDLPLNGRNATDLIVLTGAAIQTGSSVVQGVNTGVTMAVAGGQSYSTYYALDGAMHIDWYDATNMPLPFPDALQEFKVETSVQNATAGTHSGAQVNAVTKSGTNAFHGDAFEFFRNSDLNARNFFAATHDGLKRNQYGGVLGGPIKKNKLFFFAGFQGTEVRQTPVSSTGHVPTAAMEAGDFSAFESAACNNGTAVTLKAPFATINGVPDQLAASLISPVAQKISTYYPAAINSCGQTIYGSPLSQYYWQIPARLDYQFSEKQSFFLRYLLTKQDQVLPSSLDNNNILASTGNSTDDMVQSAALGETYLFSATRINSLRLSMQRIGGLHDGTRFFSPQDVGINAYTYVQGVMGLSITGGPSIGSGSAFQLPHDTFLTVNDDFNWIIGAHQLTFGGMQAHTKIYTQGEVFSVGSYSFTGSTLGSGMGDFFAGDLDKLTQSGPNGNNVENWFSTWYVQDVWKVRPRLTVNIGMRWEPWFPETVRSRKIYEFSLANFYADKVSTVWTNAPPGFTYPGDPGFNGISGLNPRWANFEPRVGIAWDPFGDGKTSIRMGAGSAYDAANEELYSNTSNVAPFNGSTAVNGPVPIANPWSTTPGGDPFPFYSKQPIGAFVPAGTFVPVPPNLKTTELYSWNASIQRQFTPNLFASASYLGNHGIHLWDNIELNPGVYIPGNCVAGQYGLTAAGPCSSTANINSRRVLYLANPVTSADIANLTQYDDGATSSYNGLILTTQWRATSNVNLNANYTWSHCIDENSVGSTTPSAGSNYVHVNNRVLDAGNCSFDRRDLFNLTALVRTPTFSGKALRLIASGWSLSTIYRYSSGAPFSVASGLDQLLRGFSGERAQQVLANTASAYQGSACANIFPCISWLNPAAFTQPALGTYGNLGVFNVLGPKFFQFDASLVREFAIRENQRLQFRFEAFNVLNNVRFNNPAATVSTTSTFGNITSAQDPRILQIALKYTF